MTADKERGLVISITDTGAGVRRMDLDRMMDPFFQVDSKFNRKCEDTGLGFSLARSLVDLHEGHME